MQIISIYEWNIFLELSFINNNKLEFYWGLLSSSHHSNSNPKISYL